MKRRKAGETNRDDGSPSAERLLLRMHAATVDAGVRCRALVAAMGGYDWADRPPRPGHPGPWPFVSPEDPGYPFHAVSTEHAAYYAAERAFRLYDRDWPEIRGKIVRRMLRRGWLTERDDGRFVVTAEGRAAWHLLRFGRAEGSPPVKRSKRRPQGARLLVSRYRWHREGRGRRGSRWRPAGHCVHEAVQATAAALATAEASEPLVIAEGPDRRRKGWKRYKAKWERGDV